MINPGDGRAPVLFCAFNRPDLFGEVLAAVKNGGRRQVFVSIDGPRPGHNDDRRCGAVSELAHEIDWASELSIREEGRNLGCGPAVSSAITWALSKVPEVIVLEDDCLPDPSFLRFCDELLALYRDDERVMQIGGTNWGAATERFSKYSYAFTSFAPIWGWATWRRAWDLYDYELESWPRVKEMKLGEAMSLKPRFRRLLHRDWDRIRAGGVGTWDHQWQYTVLRHHGLSACPQRNLITNIGLRGDATQLSGGDRVFAGLSAGKLSFPLRHPPEVAPNAAVEAVFGRIYWQKRGRPAELLRRLLGTPRLRRVLRAAVRRLVPRPT